MSKLFAVYLGGHAPRASIELHDVIFVVGARIEDCYGQVLDKWFGTPGEVHIDSWLELDIVDGWKIELGAAAPPQKEKLFFVNLGGYNTADFTELHAIRFHVAHSAAQAKTAALARPFAQDLRQPHRDDLLDVDDCLAVESVDGLRVILTRTSAVSAQKPSNRYQEIPKSVIAAWLARRR